MSDNKTSPQVFAVRAKTDRKKQNLDKENFKRERQKHKKIVEYNITPYITSCHNIIIIPIVILYVTVINHSFGVKMVSQNVPKRSNHAPGHDIQLGQTNLHSRQKKLHSRPHLQTLSFCAFTAKLRESRNSVTCGPNDLIFWLHA